MMNLKKMMIITAGLFSLAACTTTPNSVNETTKPSEAPIIPITSTCSLNSDTLKLDLIIDGIENNMVTSITVRMASSYDDWGSSKEDMTGMNDIVALYFNDLLAQSLNIENKDAIKADTANIFTDEGIDYKASVDADVLAQALGIEGMLTVEALTESLSSSSFSCDAIKAIG